MWVCRLCVSVLMLTMLSGIRHMGYVCAHCVRRPTKQCKNFVACFVNLARMPSGQTGAVCETSAEVFAFDILLYSYILTC